MIADRQGLIIALHEACELEHGLACLYLFAAFSLKDEEVGLTQEQSAKCQQWKGNILKIAREEMEHLATVCNLVTAVGGAAHFGRPNFPQPANYYSDMPEFKLTRFSLAALQRFVEFERRHDAPAVIAGIAPEPLIYRHVGELYALIREGFSRLDEATLFIGPPGGQDDEFSGTSVHPHKVTNRAEALRAIDMIVERGEGTATQPPESHYQIFRRIFLECQALMKLATDFDPARPVADNPLTRPARDATVGTIIEDATTRDVAELFNSVYATLLLMLRQYYSFDSESADQRDALRVGMQLMMTDVVRPLGEALTRLPMGPHAPGKTAGPGFQLYGDDTCLVAVKIAWRILLERLDREAAEAKRLIATVAALTTVADSIAGVRDELKANAG
jgi:hypothetical protein